LMAWEIMAEPVLFSPLARFFVGLLLVLVWAVGSLIFIYWIYTMYGKDE
jgi:hypothetical protein